MSATKEGKRERGRENNDAKTVDSFRGKLGKLMGNEAKTGKNSSNVERGKTNNERLNYSRERVER